MRTQSAPILSVGLIILLTSSLAAAADDEALGRAAEQSGKLREALTHYVAALQSAPEGSSTEQRLRETIITLVRKLDPPPAVPEEAERRMARGRAAVKTATDAKDFLEAAAEFQKAARAAPWLPEVYFNLGVVSEKAGRYEEARRNLKLYLTAAPNASDAKQVREQLYELEFQAEKAERRAEEERKKIEEARVRTFSAPLESLAGEWRDDDLFQKRGIINLRLLKVSGSTITIYPQMKDSNSRFAGWDYEQYYCKGTVNDGRISGSWLANKYYDGPRVGPCTGEISPDGRRMTIDQGPGSPFGENVFTR